MAVRLISPIASIDVGGCRVSGVVVAEFAVITAIIGRPGAGKTYRMVYYVYRRRLRGPLDVATNIGSLVERGLPGVGRLDYVDSMREAFCLHHCTLLLDEAHLWFGSAERASHGPEYADWVSQLRKVKLDLLYTSQASGAVDKMLRDRTDATCLVTSFVKLGLLS